MRKLTFAVLCLVLCMAALATDPRPAAAADGCEEGCCADMQRQAEYSCSYSWVRYFYCVEGYAGSCCAATWDCAPPWA